MRGRKEALGIYGLHEAAPEKRSDLGTHMDYVKHALHQHRISLAPHPTHVQDDGVPLSLEMETEGTPEAYINVLLLRLS